MRFRVLLFVLKCPQADPDDSGSCSGLVLTYRRRRRRRRKPWTRHGYHHLHHHLHHLNLNPNRYDNGLVSNRQLVETWQYCLGRYQKPTRGGLRLAGEVFYRGHETNGEEEGENSWPNMADNIKPYPCR